MSLPVRFSHLRAYGRSAMHGRLSRDKEAAQTREMQRGTAVDALIFGTRKVCGYPGPVRRGKEYDAFCLEHEDFEILTSAEYAKARAMADAVLDCKLAQPLLQGVQQQTIFFRWMGLDCRSTPDVRGPDYLTELKTASSSDPYRAPWHFRKLAYHAQLMMQSIAVGLDGAHHMPENHYIVCVESSEPYPVTCFHVEPRALLEGEKLLITWAERLKNCEASNVYPPYIDCIVPFDVPEEEPDFVFGDDTEEVA